MEIISAVPFTNLPPTAVTDFFETYRDILKDDGVFTFIEFAFGRTVYRTLAKGEEKERLKAVSDVVNEYRHNYQVKHRFVLFNVPPARVRSLRFDD